MSEIQAGSPIQLDDEARFTQLRAYTGDVLFTENMPCGHMYIIKDGEVDLYTIREEKRVVVETLGKGDCFGMTAHLLGGGRISNAVAKSYCELFVIDADTLQAHVEASPKLVRNIMNTLAKRISRTNELISTRVNYQPEIIIYAQLLNLLGMADVGGRKPDARNAQAKPVLAKPLLSEVFSQARVLFGHSDLHIRHILGKLLTLHLIQIVDESGDGKRVMYSPHDIAAKARKAVGTHKDEEKLQYEYVSVGEFAAMVDVEPPVLLSKLARSEFSEDIFTFRKSEILRILDMKGRKFFYERKIKTPEEFTELADIEFADQKSIYEVLARYDIYDLAKVVAGLEEEGAKLKVLDNLPKAKREDVEYEVSTLGAVDPVEVRQLGGKMIAAIQELMTKKKK